MPIVRRICGLLFFVTALQAQTVQIGDGAPTAGIKQTFVDAWTRNGFNLLVADPTVKVTTFGTAGLIQVFPSINNSTTQLALVKPDTTEASNVRQVLAPMYAYYSTVGVNNAGYPVLDTGNCPTSTVSGIQTCQLQYFDKNYALFIYTPALNGVTNLATRDPYYSKWQTLGGIQSLGPAITPETAVTGLGNSGGTAQFFSSAVVVNLTSGSFSGKVIGIRGAIYALYTSLGNFPNATLGLPTGEELNIAGGKVRQSFEGGAIDYDPATGVATLRPPVVSLVLNPKGTAQLNAGDTLQAQVTLIGSDGSNLTDRPVAWATTNGRVAQVNPNGLSATITALSAGTATISVSADGRTSATLVLTVKSTCCQIGEGAPTQTLQRAFQTAVQRNKLTVQLPAASGAIRSGAGYIQELFNTAPSPVRYIVAVPDRSAAGYVVGGTTLDAWDTLGGADGSIGYPTSDLSAGGRQSFQQADLAGKPVQAVSGAIRTKWVGLSAETGVAGSPTSSASAFQTFRGTAGLAQLFQNALIVASTTGPLAGQTYIVSGPVLTLYNSASGVAGDLGAPSTDERTLNGVRQQDFEGGTISYPLGTTNATIKRNTRQPLVTATPSIVTAGAFVHLTVGGFADASNLRVSQSGAADFQVRTPNGSYAWDVRVPATASGTVTVSATDPATNTTAQATYTIRNANGTPFKLTVINGDQQTGAPGALLPESIIVRVADQNGNALPGEPVTFNASSGTLSATTALTDAAGTASVRLRMPFATGLSLVTAQAGSQVVSISSRSTAFSLPNFPVFKQDANGPLVAAIASIVRFHQLQNDVPRPNGLADPAAIDKFLTGYCVAATLCDGYLTLPGATDKTPNLFRVGAFVGNNLDAQLSAIDDSAARDSILNGFPVLLSLLLKTGGSNFVVAYGIGADSSLQIADPLYGQTSLSAYSRGFSIPNNEQAGVVTGSAQLLPQSPSATGFFVYSNSKPVVTSVSGSCGSAFPIQDLRYLVGCNGTAGPYQLDFSNTFNAIFTDLSTGGGATPITATAAASRGIVRANRQWNVGDLALTFAPTSVVNAASFTPELSPGAIFSIFGAGFVRSGSPTSVQIGGKPASIIATLPFQLNAQVPVDATPGATTLSVTSGNGTLQQALTIKATSPAIFSVGGGLGAITNQNNSLNSPSNPATRGSVIVIYGTGLGATNRVGPLNPAVATTTAVINGAELPAAFAGLTPGFIGLYQVNVSIPANFPPGLALPITIKQGTVISNAVTVAIQ